MLEDCECALRDQDAPVDGGHLHRSPGFSGKSCDNDTNGSRGVLLFFLNAAFILYSHSI